ncbi:hypothetical protein [Kriegella aquimaris]|uniref:Heparinase II/III-like protein n=1 Tax=Kriegella aquimaris TaxID=192904 RepID=A0A1G9TN63_9FLAO|nr:hypothetical protein [Kriegella aquimaris]SDM49082.1 hypothetical protein SAMN04488514_109132 [Kriegella aquimaris]
MKIPLVLIFLLISILCFSQDFSNYDKRKQFIIEGLKNVTLTERGKHGLPKAIARLESDPHDGAALTYITNDLENRHQSMFDFPGIALALCRYWDSFNAKQLEKIKGDLENLAKPDKQNGEGFLGHGTENHATMMWSSAYLFGQLFPDAKWANGMTSDELMADMKERLRKTFKNVYAHGYTEYLSTTYEVVMNFPVEILLEYAKDPEMKAIAEAFMLYKWSLLSLNNFEGNILAPYGRMNTQQDHLSDDSYISATTYYNWLMWGWGPATSNMKMHQFDDYSEASYTIFSALSGVVPPSVFFQLAGNDPAPFELKTSASTFGHYGSAAPHQMMRKVYRNKTYAIGTGNFRWVPGGDYADHDANGFNITYHSPDRFNYINCFHPYWYSDGDEKDRTPDTWYKGNISPFQQTAHSKNTVITLFNIPEKDPWVNTPSESKWAWRDGHADNLIKRGMLRYPKSVDEKVEENGWIFLREGDTYIGIKPLKSYYEQTDLKGTGLDGFNIVKSDYAQTGFVFELGSKAESGSFEKFRRTLKKNRLSIDWKNMSVTYTDSQKEKLQIQYKDGLPIATENEMPEHLVKKGINGMAESVPTVKIENKKEKGYRQWPMIESPFINMNSSVLRIHDGTTDIEVDWQADYPVIKK